MYGSHYIKGYSKTQTAGALSSAEADLYTAVKTPAELLGVISVYRDFGVTLKGSILGDASAALGMIKRKGIGATRYIGASFLWVQEQGATREIDYEKIAGKENPADLFTKHLSGDDIDKHMASMQIEFMAGADEIALTINEVKVKSGIEKAAAAAQPAPLR